jgi:hypothetical protein
MTDLETSKGNSKPILKGFSVALRDREFFHLLDDIFVAMDVVQRGLEPKLSKSGHHFLSENFGQQIATIWEMIKLQYQTFPSSISVPPVRRNMPGLTPEEVIENNRILDLAELDELDSRFQALFPEAADSRYAKTATFFLNFFAHGESKNIANDKSICLEALERVCLHLAGLKTPKEIELRQKNHKEAHDVSMQRQVHIRSLFSRGSTNLVAANSASMRSLLMSRTSKARVHFFDGSRHNSMDGELGGFHGSGLTCFIGGTGGFKTGVMSSLVANHVMRFVDGLDEEPAEIWCYIGEDGAEAYPRRILVNLINRLAKRDSDIKAILKAEGRELTLGTFDLFRENREFEALVDALLDGPMSGLNFIRAPETPEEMVSFSVINILDIFESKISNEDKKPRVIILDYLNLLHLPRSASYNTRAEEINVICHMLDEWGNKHKIPMVTAVQASADGNIRAREMEFYNQEHTHECKSVMHHCRMLLSLLTYEDVTSKDEWGRHVHRLAVKVLKNRDGSKGDIFRTGLDYGKNIALADSEKMSEDEWLTHRKQILDQKAALIEGTLGDSNYRGGGQKQGGYQKGQGKPYGQGGQQAYKNSAYQKPQVKLSVVEAKKPDVKNDEIASTAPLSENAAKGASSPEIHASSDGSSHKAETEKTEQLVSPSTGAALAKTTEQTKREDKKGTNKNANKTSDVSEDEGPLLFFDEFSRSE